MAAFMDGKHHAPIALLGGTFDPIHYGHTQPALELADQFGWSQIHLQPSFAPPHRPAPEASEAQRLAMVELACMDDHRLVADDFELRQQAPTRTVHTLRRLQSLHPTSSLCFMLGMDSFITFTSWLHWQQIFEYAHLVVLPRPGYDLSNLPQALDEQLRLRQSNLPDDFNKGAGRIYIASTTQQNVSATELRKQLAASMHTPHAPCPSMLAPQVYAYIQTHQLYLKLT